MKQYDEIPEEISSSVVEEPMFTGYMAVKHRSVHPHVSPSVHKQTKEQKAQAFARRYFSPQDVHELESHHLFVDQSPARNMEPTTEEEWEALLQECDADEIVPESESNAFWTRLSKTWSA